MLSARGDASEASFFESRGAAFAEARGAAFRASGVATRLGAARFGGGDGLEHAGLRSGDGGRHARWDFLFNVSARVNRCARGHGTALDFERAAELVG